MGTKGLTFNSASRDKMSLSKTKDRTELHQKLIEYIATLQKTDFPSLTQSAIYAGLTEKALLAYEFRTAEDSEIRIILDHIRDLQKIALTENGLKRIYDGRLSSMLLKANHGLKEETPSLTQNNNFNITPEILSEAIQLMRSKKD